MTGEPNWREWALWLAVQLRFVLRLRATRQERAAAQRAVDEFDSEVHAYELRRWRDLPRDESASSSAALDEDSPASGSTPSTRATSSGELAYHARPPAASGAPAPVRTVMPKPPIPIETARDRGQPLVTRATAALHRLAVVIRLSPLTAGHRRPLDPPAPALGLAASKVTALGASPT